MNLLEFYSLRFYCLSFFFYLSSKCRHPKFLQYSLEKTHQNFIFLIQSFFLLSFFPIHLTNAVLYVEHSSDFHWPATVVRKLTYVF